MNLTLQVVFSNLQVKHLLFLSLTNCFSYLKMIKVLLAYQVHLELFISEVQFHIKSHVARDNELKHSSSVDEF